MEIINSENKNYNYALVLKKDGQYKLISTYKKIGNLSLAYLGYKAYCEEINLPEPLPIKKINKDWGFRILENLINAELLN